jgi:hypothetical protein
MLCSFGHPIVLKAVLPAREAQLVPVRQVPTMGQAHGEDRVPHIEHGHVGGCVGLRARMGLHIGMLRPKEHLGPVDGQSLHHIHTVAPTIVAVGGVTLSVLVGEHGTLRLQYGAADIVLRGDQLDRLSLAPGFVGQSRGQLRILHRQNGVLHRCVRTSHLHSNLFCSQLGHTRHRYPPLCAVPQRGQQGASSQAKKRLTSRASLQTTRPRYGALLRPMARRATSRPLTSALG